MWPLCGGFFVKNVNSATTTCFGGPAEADCYVAELDFSALNLADDSALRTATQEGRALVRGHFEQMPNSQFKVARLVVSEAYQAQANAVPNADAEYYGVENSGIVCITYPCPTLVERKLNTLELQQLAGLDLTASGASKASIEAAGVALQTGAVLVAGTHGTVSGPGGEGLSLTATEFYLAVMGKPAGELCGLNVCGAGEYCCNPSCGICAPLNGACIEIACAPLCDHDVCSKGPALEKGCSVCVTKVCNQDPYCCDNEWDGICVGEAKTLCGECAEPEPEPTCAHSECEKGATLEASCSPCATAVCNYDAYCCATSWDALCVSEAEQLCKDVCKAPEQPACAHSECKKGAKLVDSCSPCAAAVCGQDPYCCNNAWDKLCVSQAQTLCPSCN